MGRRSRGGKLTATASEDELLEAAIAEANAIRLEDKRNAIKANIEAAKAAEILRINNRILAEAVASRDEKAVLQQLNAGACPDAPCVSVLGAIGSLVLHEACYTARQGGLLSPGGYGCDDDVPENMVVNHLIAARADVNAKITVGDGVRLRRGSTPLHFAAMAGCQYAATKLVEAGAMTNVVNDDTKYGAPDASRGSRVSGLDVNGQDSRR